MADVLVIGASRGIGFELVRQHRAAGDRVVGTARDDAALDRLRALGAVAHRVDVATAEGCASLAWPLDGERFDVVWLVAGVFGPSGLGAPRAPSADDFDAVMHTNVLAAMRLAGTLDGVLADGAKVALLSSKMGSIAARTNAGAWLYRASKAALNSVAADLALLWRGRATVVVFHPGWVRTDMGGADADLAVERSASDLRASLARATPADSGAFWNHDGDVLPW